MDTQITMLSGSFDVFWHVEQGIAIQKSLFVEDFLNFLATEEDCSDMPSKGPFPWGSFRYHGCLLESASFPRS